MALFLHHPYIAQLAAYDEDKLILFLVLYPFGSVESWVNKSSSLKLTEYFDIINGVYKALCDLHNLGIVHNDIKPSNILLDIENDLIIPKLTDFGICNIVEETVLKVSAFKVQNIRGLSLSYASPERLNRNLIFDPKYEKAGIQVAKGADIYSMGITCYFIMNRQHPWIQDKSTNRTETTQDMSDNGVTLRNPNQLSLSIPGYLAMPSSSYQLTKVLHSGGFGSVHLGKLVNSNTIIVAKKMFSSTRDAFIQEVSIMSMFVNHDNFAQMVGYNESQFTIIMVYYPMGSVETW